MTTKSEISNIGSIFFLRFGLGVIALLCFTFWWTSPNFKWSDKPLSTYALTISVFLCGLFYLWWRGRHLEKLKDKSGVKLFFWCVGLCFGTIIFAVIIGFLPIIFFIGFTGFFEGIPVLWLIFSMSLIFGSIPILIIAFVLFLFLKERLKSLKMTDETLNDTSTE